MNSLAKCIKYNLIVVNSADYLQQLYKLCMEKVKEGCIVVLFTSEYYDFSKLLEELIINKDELKNLVLMYYETIEDISHKLLLLHSWSLLPSIVVVDLTQLLRLELEACPSVFLIQKVALCTVSLLAFLQSIALKLSGITKDDDSLNIINGLLILRSEGENFGDTQIQTLKDLYFYQTDIHENFDGIRILMHKECNHISET